MKREEANDQRVLALCRAEAVSFVCECADEDCRRSVVLSPGAFISRRENGEFILYPGHEPLEDAPMAAEREEARASDLSVIPPPGAPRAVRRAHSAPGRSKR
jgi:hypothetical protein